MALFRIFKGAESGLNAVPCHEGYAYFTQDSGKLFIDIASTEGSRVQVNAYAAETLMKETAEGVFEFIDVDDLLLKNAVLSVNQGGTGANTLTVNALLVGNGENPIKMIAIDANGIVAGDATNGVKSLTGTGILYTLADGAPQFGIAPIEVGGTGGNTATKARENLDVYSKAEVRTEVGKATSNTYTTTLIASGWIGSGDTYTYTYNNSSIKCGANGNTPPLITYSSNQDEYSKINSAEAEPGVGIVFTTGTRPTADIGLIITDLG